MSFDADHGFAVKNSRGEGGGDIEHGGKVDVTCALCHTITNGAAPHPFCVRNASRRAGMAAFLRSLDTGR